MNLGASSSSTGPSSTGSPSSQRKERGAIAAQACDTCRSRKQRCDEQRPKCGLCTRMKLECRYREPQPTKKDKTLVEILDRLKTLEGKVDRLPMQPSLPARYGAFQSSPASQPSFPADAEQASYKAASLQSSQQSPSRGSGRSQPHIQASTVHKMLAWPAVQHVLAHAHPSNATDLHRSERDGSAFILSLQETTPKLPLDEALAHHPFLGSQTQATGTGGGAGVAFPELTKDIMLKLATSYFDTFNLIYPFMDRQSFLSDTLSKVCSEGFNGDTESVIALLVFSLGELAMSGSRGQPMDIYQGRASGMRGGSANRPPGLALFNEARKRIGFVMTDCDLENVQIFSLSALYYESCSRHVDFWRLTVSASLACQLLVTCTSVDWDSQRGDLIKRAYWHCASMETGLHLELDLPWTGVVSLEDIVPLPSFNTRYCEADHNGNLASHFEAHFASQIALRRICATAHNNINESMDIEPQNGSSEDYNGPTATVLNQLSLELIKWKGLLPTPLQWPENDPCAFPSEHGASQLYNQPLDPSLASRGQHGHITGKLFTGDLDSEPVQYPYLYDIQVALLRTRYYYAKYIIHRPFIYKALHFPDQMTQSDAEGVAECLKSCLKWPVLLSPPSRQKRLIPYLFCWSQNCLGILLIFHMTHQSPVLGQIRQQLAAREPQFEQDVEETIGLMLDWIRDLKGSDPIAQWCCDTLRGIYQMDP